MIDENVAHINFADIHLYIQPQFSIKTKQVIAGEVLSRWMLHDGTMVMPENFIPYFEKYEQIHDFDFYVLESLCRKMKTWIEKGFVMKPISINQSLYTIDHGHYVKQFCSIVDEYGIAHHLIAIEVTESIWAQKKNLIKTRLQELHKQGFSIMIDDYGSGYTSLQMLSIIPATVLKIDKSLLHTDENSIIILRHTIEMAHELGMGVLCEGIESQRQLHLLQTLLCDYGQGFLVDEAIPADLFQEQYLKGEWSIWK